MGSRRAFSVSFAFAFAFALTALSGCANQKEVIPMLHVEPNAGPRMLYFERRSRELFGASAESTEERQADEEDASEPEGSGARRCAPALRTWGASVGDADGGEGTSCDSARND